MPTELTIRSAAADRLVHIGVTLLAPPDGFDIIARTRSTGLGPWNPIDHPMCHPCQRLTPPTRPPNDPNPR